MALRSRLIIAFLLLSVVPLSAVTFVTYRSWVSTFENAARREADQSAIDIGRRMERITSDVGRRMDRMLIEARGSSGTAPESAAMRQRVAPMLGDAAALVERVEFQPMPPRPEGTAPASRRTRTSRWSASSSMDWPRRTAAIPAAAWRALRPGPRRSPVAAAQRRAADSARGHRGGCGAGD